MDVPTWLLLLIAALAVARLTHLITTDVLLDTPRAVIVGRRPTGLLAYWVTCPWCVSIWTGAGVTAALWAWPHAWWTQAPAFALAASYVTGVAEQLLNDDD